MRSYHRHIGHLASRKAEAVTRKPTYRASAIFPAFQEEGISSRILFMGYWFRKRHIREVGILLTLRDEVGSVLYRLSETVRGSKAYRYELSDLLQEVKYEGAFRGSLELEVFSAVNILFPYPAAVVNYYGPNFSAVVHTAQRVYNDFEDMQVNSGTKVPESGFNIYADGDKEPFITLINGIEKVENTHVDMEFYNHKKEILNYHLSLGDLNPYETRVLYPARDIDLKKFLENHVGACKMSFDVRWIYPRLIVGNRQNSLPAVNITHTYYDCSDQKNKSNYWFNTDPKWHPASLLVPLNLKSDHYTNAYFYPILPPSTLSVDVTIYSASGEKLGFMGDVLTLESPFDEYQKIPFLEITEALGIDKDQPLAARITAKPEDANGLPARIKLGLDLGIGKTALPCNICTNLHPFNPSLENKPSCFRWGPFLSDQKDSVVWILNSSPKKNYQRRADVQILFHREADERMIERKLDLSPHGFHVICLRDDEELKEFFQGKTGWFTASSTNPYLLTYYFAENTSGVVGGDHGF